MPHLKSSRRIAFPFAFLSIVLYCTSPLVSNEGPTILLRGRVSLPAGVERLDLIGELVERKQDQPFHFDVTPINIQSDMTFETRTTVVAEPQYLELEKDGSIRHVGTVVAWFG